MRSPLPFYGVSFKLIVSRLSGKKELVCIPLNIFRGLNVYLHWQMPEKHSCGWWERRKCVFKAFPEKCKTQVTKHKHLSIKARELPFNMGDANERKWIDMLIVSKHTPKNELQKTKSIRCDIAVWQNVKLSLQIYWIVSHLHLLIWCKFTSSTLSYGWWCTSIP